MTLRLVFAVVAVICGVLVALVTLDDPSLVIGLGLVAAGLATVIDR